MKQRPILFSTEMVQAILAGRKTQTRRVVKPQPIEGLEHVSGDLFFDKHTSGILPKSFKCPYGKKGDVLWVREAFCYNDDDGYSSEFSYKADHPTAKGWKPSIHMPKDAARIWLRIKDVRVERLNEISEQDAEAEGIEQFTKDGVGFKYGLDGWHWSLHTGAPFMCNNRRMAFYTLWCLINGEQSWRANPWVWVVEFERIEKPQS